MVKGQREENRGAGDLTKKKGGAQFEIWERNLRAERKSRTTMIWEEKPCLEHNYLDPRGKCKQGNVKGMYIGAVGWAVEGKREAERELSNQSADPE